MDSETSVFMIEKLGGTAEVARLCRVSSQAVSKWRRQGIPAARGMYLLAIRPDLAEALNTHSTSKAQAA